MSAAEIEKSALRFLEKGTDSVGLMHQKWTRGSGRIVESYIHRGPDYTVEDMSGTKQVIKTGSWLLGVVWNDEAWEAIQKGDIVGYSLQGYGRQVPVDKSAVITDQVHWPDTLFGIGHCVREFLPADLPAGDEDRYHAKTRVSFEDVLLGGQA